MSDVLDLKIPDNDSGATTVRGYLKALLSELWSEEEGFSGKRPFGNSGWKWDLAPSLIQAGLVPGTVDEDGDITGYDDAAADKLILEAISRL